VDCPREPILDAISGSPGVSPSRFFIRGGELEKIMANPYVFASG
jgi:hypothetical protein